MSKTTEKTEVVGDGRRGSFLRTIAALSVDDKEFTVETREASPAHFLIKIESFSLFSERGIRKYESREFGAGDYKWRLEIHPDGLIKRTKDEDNHISVYLAIINNSSLPGDLEVNAIFSIFLYNHILDSYLCFRGKMRRFHALMKTKWGFSKLISKKSLLDPSNGFLIDDTCVFGAEVFVIKSQLVTQQVSVLEIGNAYKRDWKISQFSKLKEVWHSEEFTVGDHKWKIALHPNGHASGNGRNVSMYLESVDAKNFAPHEKVKADFCIHIKNQLRDAHHSKDSSHCFRSSECDWGWGAFIPLADMHDPSKGFIVNDCCIVEIEFSVKEEE